MSSSIFRQPNSVQIRHVFGTELAARLYTNELPDSVSWSMWNRSVYEFVVTVTVYGKMSRAEREVICFDPEYTGD